MFAKLLKEIYMRETIKRILRHFLRIKQNILRKIYFKLILPSFKKFSDEVSFLYIFVIILGYNLMVSVRFYFKSQ